jgi:hypothetical protein
MAKKINRVLLIILLFLIVALGFAVWLFIPGSNPDGQKEVQQASIRTEDKRVELPEPVLPKKPEVKKRVTAKKAPVVKAVKAKSGVKTEDEIFEEYGRIEILSLYDGRHFTGAIKERGDTIVFETDKGILTFEARTVRDTRIIK